MKRPQLSLLGAASFGSLFVAGSLATLGCSPSGNQTTLSGSGGANSSGTSQGGSTAATFSGGTANGGTQSTGATGGCTGLACQIHQCSGGGSTTISGTIYDPAGKNPLYGVVAYVPNSTPTALTQGASCTSCSDLYTGDPIAAAVSDAKGNFTIKNAPDGANIPLVIQVGKWRRQFTIPNVAMCMDTPAPVKLTLPKNGTEGDIPNMAISTGGADTMECLLTRIGLDKSEYSGGANGGGHVHIFVGSGGATTPGATDSPSTLWPTAAGLMKYDIVILSCEGNETTFGNKPQDQQALFDYAKQGGRVFASHYHYAWFNSGPFGSQNLASWTPGSQGAGSEGSIVTTDWAGMPFIRGQAMHDWLQNVNALGVNGAGPNRLPIVASRHNADVSMANTPSQRWVVIPSNTQSTQDFTFDTPFGVPAAMQCGRVAFSDMHVSGASNDPQPGSDQNVPQGCAVADLSPQEKALEFIFFDLASCVTPNNMPQMPPGNPPM